ncbi:synaptonemal complex protein 2 isoform X4 [Rhizophagus clarus]|uniref:Synaptonemal complex protein 2 isoform X4 n=1 Tax=Rhizophagus clarus TaxID=94130 RepID=A0A8H3QFR0_9GLOM|nr:synaptonemal complex protein 2 isoform X4 [Rhizophagus clarus]
MSHPLKAAFHELSNVLNSEILLENERKRRGRPRRKENSLAVKELQKVLQKLHKILEEAEARFINYGLLIIIQIFQQAINSFKEVFNKYKDVADITKKATNCLNCTVKVIICMGLLKSGDDNDWEKTAIDLLTLIENFIQQGDGDREMLGKLCLKPLIETLTNSSLPTDLRKTSADVINAFLTGCKENKKLLSQEQFFDASDLVSSMVTASDYELQLCHLEILFRLCPRVQEDRKTFVNKAFMIHKDMIQKFLAITVDDFFGDTRYFLNSLNELNDGISKMPKTLVASQIKYNQNELNYPEGQDRFFVDFNKWTISTTIKSTEADDSVDNDMLEIKYSKILTWDLQIESKGYVLRLYLSGHLKLGSQYSVGTRSKRIFSVSDNEIIVLIRFDNDVKDDLKIMFADRRVEKKMQPSKVPISPVLQQKFDNVELNLSKSSGTLITPKNGTQIDKQIIKLLKDVNLDNKSLSFDPVTETKVPQNCIAAYNTGPSFSVGNPLEKQIFKNSRITPTTPSHSYTKLQIFDAECHNIFQSRRRSKSLNLKKQTDNKRDNIKEDNKLSNMVKKEFTGQDTLQNQDDDFIMMELNNEADHVINEQEFRFYGISNLASADNIKNPNHGKRKRKSQDSIEDNLKKPKFNNIIKKNREQIKINNNRSSPIKSEDEFWNPPKNDTTGPTEDEVIERMRAQFPMECFRELMGKSVTSNNEKKQEKLKGSLDSDDEEINNGQYILHTRDSSLTISSNNETTKQCSENATYDNKVNDVTPINSRYANEKFDEEIKRLLQCVGETIFRQFRSQDAALFQETQKKIIQNETSLAQELKTQFKRKNQLLDEFKRNYTSIAIEDRQMIKKLKEGRKELASLEQTLLEMEKTESGISKI